MTDRDVERAEFVASLRAEIFARRLRARRCQQTAATMLQAITGTPLATDIISTTPTTVTWAIGEQRFYLEEAFAMQQQVLDDLDAAPEVEPGDERDESAENFVRMVVGWMDFNISSGPEMEAIVLMNRLERLRQTGRVTLLPDGWDSLWSDPRTDSVRLAQQRAERTPTPLPTD
jgi:hypothetical protein